MHKISNKDNLTIQKNDFENNFCDICFEESNLKIELCNCIDKNICKKCFMNIIILNQNYYICPFCKNKNYIKSEIIFKLNKPQNISLI